MHSQSPSFESDMMFKSMQISGGCGTAPHPPEFDRVLLVDIDFTIDRPLPLVDVHARPGDGGTRQRGKPPVQPESPDTGTENRLFPDVSVRWICSVEVGIPCLAGSRLPRGGDRFQGQWTEWHFAAISLHDKRSFRLEYPFASSWFSFRLAKRNQPR